jgi:hypothetical protein
MFGKYIYLKTSLSLDEHDQRDACDFNIYLITAK